MKYLKHLMLTVCLFTCSVTFAGSELVERMCHPILEKKCKLGDCKDVNLNLVIDMLYNKCENSVNDVERLKDKTDVVTLNLNSDVGYLIGFSNLISRALSGKALADKYININEDYLALISQYKKYLSTNSVIFLSSLDFLEANNKSLKDKLLDEYNASQQKISQRIAKLEIMLQSESDLNKYRNTHLKFIPAIIFESNADKFKGKVFTSYECNFLKLNFDEIELKDLQNTLKYNCENS